MKISKVKKSKELSQESKVSDLISLLESIPEATLSELKAALFGMAANSTITDLPAITDPLTGADEFVVDPADLGKPTSSCTVNDVVAAVQEGVSQSLDANALIMTDSNSDLFTPITNTSFNFPEQALKLNSSNYSFETGFTTQSSAISSDNVSTIGTTTKSTAISSNTVSFQNSTFCSVISTGSVSLMGGSNSVSIAAGNSANTGTGSIVSGQNSTNSGNYSFVQGGLPGNAISNQGSYNFIIGTPPASTSHNVDNVLAAYYPSYIDLRTAYASIGPDDPGAPVPGVALDVGSGSSTLRIRSVPNLNTIAPVAPEKGMIALSDDEGGFYGAVGAGGDDWRLLNSGPVVEAVFYPELDGSNIFLTPFSVPFANYDQWTFIPDFVSNVKLKNFGYGGNGIWTCLKPGIYAFKLIASISAGVTGDRFFGFSFVKNQIDNLPKPINNFLCEAGASSAIDNEYVTSSCETPGIPMEVGNTIGLWAIQLNNGAGSVSDLLFGSTCLKIELVG
jgi:hypothetical protein